MSTTDTRVLNVRPKRVGSNRVAPDRAGGLGRWAATVLATAAATWALDAVAAVAGVLLIASSLFDGATRPLVVGFLAASYLAWGAGLRANLGANWRLLVETGTSTNALSKVAFEFARGRSSNQAVVRGAAAVGYVVTEIAKEVPYYAGAFGMTLFSTAVDSTDALVFLAGANLGAAIYEYGVARLTRTHLDRRSRRREQRRRQELSPGTNGL